MNIFELIYKSFKITKPIRLIELFAGYGSQALALKYLNANFEHYKVCEFDKYAIETYNAIHNTNFSTSDIKELRGKDLEIVDKHIFTYLLTYSFPCTDLSLAGKRKGMEKGSGTRSGLLWEVERLLKELNGNLPQVLVMENVPQVLTANGWFEWCNFLEELGYKNYCEVLNAKDYFIPQKRERCFMISILGDYVYKFPNKMKLEYRVKNFLEEKVDEKYYLSQKFFDCFMGKNYKNKNYDRKKIFTRALYNTNKIGIANTITTREANTPNANFIIESENKIRRLTPKEVFRLMGLIDSDIDKITVSNSQKYKQAGNSIVVSVLIAIFANLLDLDYKTIIKTIYRR